MGQRRPMALFAEGTRTLRRRIQHYFHQSRARNAVSQRVMQPPNQSSATAFQTIDHVNIPQRLAAVEQLAENAPGQGFQFGLSARTVEAHPEDVATDVEVRI